MGTRRRAPVTSAADCWANSPFGFGLGFAYDSLPDCQVTSGGEHGVNVFELGERVVAEYGEYVRSLVEIQDSRITRAVDDADEGLLWPEPYIGLNPAFEPGCWIDDLVAQGLLHPECGRILKPKEHPDDAGARLPLHRHQEDAIRRAHSDRSYVLTTGTGSGKRLAYIIPIVDLVLVTGSGSWSTR